MTGGNGFVRFFDVFFSRQNLFARTIAFEAKFVKSKCFCGKQLFLLLYWHRIGKYGE
jgi:hypothetical protein